MPAGVDGSPLRLNSGAMETSLFSPLRIGDVGISTTRACSYWNC
jgi:hypothetical protein